MDFDEEQPIFLLAESNCANEQDVNPGTLSIGHSFESWDEMKQKIITYCIVEGHKQSVNFKEKLKQHMPKFLHL